jgi:small neutral amino acid transporter SnatA (MarC family)
MPDFVQAVSLLLALLNPFLVIIYLLDVVQRLDSRSFRRILFRAGLIAGTVFCCFGLVGDAIFSSVIQAEFGSFQIFGGIVFLLIGLQFVFRGPAAIKILRGESKHLAGAIAMPVLIGPGTISASVIIGKRLQPFSACVAIILAVGMSLVVVLLLKKLHDYVRLTRKSLVDRYIEIAGRVSALYVGTVSVEMIMQGLRTWTDKF